MDSIPPPDPREGAINRLAPGHYRVVPVICTERTCLGWDACNREGDCGSVSLQDADAGCAMICHNYRVALGPPMDRRVFWARKDPFPEEQE